MLLELAIEYLRSWPAWLVLILAGIVSYFLACWVIGRCLPTPKNQSVKLTTTERMTDPKKTQPKGSSQYKKSTNQAS